MRPRSGLSVPVITVLDGDGKLVEADERAVVRHVLQQGWGADIVFSAGTTGEWNLIDNATRQRVTQVCCEEVARHNLTPVPGGDAARRVEAWAGITAPTARETLENLDFAIACGVDGAVLAPLSIEAVGDPVRFVARDVADLLDARPSRIPIYLYDNADIAIDPRVPHIRTRQVKAMSRLDFVRGIKVSAGRKVLGNYTRAAESFRERGEFGIYVGNAMLIFDLFRPRSGPLGTFIDHWNRRRLRGSLPIGVVSGPANVLPREWQRAWRVCRAGDAERIDAAAIATGRLAQAFEASGSDAMIASIKRALVSLGVITSGAPAPGTPPLEGAAADRFDRAFASLGAALGRASHDPDVSRIGPM
jgi:dihydrodipicolinate synthase/N-acetylneuraminate lyase